MKGKLFAVLFTLAMLSVSSAFGGGIRKETFVFAVEGADTLRMDKYDIPDGGTKPCMIFMFGGGFFAGARDHERYADYMEFLAEEGMVAISIDYRLGFKDFKPDGEMKNKDFLNYFKYTVDLAVSDLFSATNYVLVNADAWGVDPDRIVTCGSSAGAVSVLHGEYERSNRTEIASVLPADFRYAGVVAFAGAIYRTDGCLQWGENPAPLMLFHGDADKNVPFGKLKVGKYGFYGSKHIAGTYDKCGYPYYFYIAENANHMIAGTPMQSEREEIMSFLRKYVMEEQQIQTRTVVRPTDYKKVKKNFGIKTYVRANFFGDM